MEEGQIQVFNNFDQKVDDIISSGTPEQLHNAVMRISHAIMNRSANTPRNGCIRNIPGGEFGYVKQREFVISIMKPIQAKNVMVRSGTNRAEIIFYTELDREKVRDIIAPKGFNLEYQ